MEGAQLWIADLAGGVHLADVSTPASPQIIGDDHLRGEGVSLDGENFVVAAGVDGIFVLGADADATDRDRCDTSGATRVTSPSTASTGLPAHPGRRADANAVCRRAATGSGHPAITRRGLPVARVLG